MAKFKLRLYIQRYVSSAKDISPNITYSSSILFVASLREKTRLKKQLFQARLSMPGRKRGRADAEEEEEEVDAEEEEQREEAEEAELERAAERRRSEQQSDQMA